MSQQHHRGGTAFPTIRFSVLARKSYPGGFFQISQRNQVALTERIKPHRSTRFGAQHRRIDLVLNILASGRRAASITAKAAFSSLQGFSFLIKWGHVAGLMGNCQWCRQKCAFVANTCVTCDLPLLLLYVCMTCDLFFPRYSSDPGFKQKRWVSFKTLECSDINY